MSKQLLVPCREVANDAQLPRRLAADLNRLGQDATHTLELPDGNATTDIEIIRLATAENRIVISKDRDFLDSFLVAGQPPRLLWVTTGNISNNDLMTPKPIRVRVRITQSHVPPA